MQAIDCAVIAAAGLGSRLGHGLPKCMLEFDGVSLLTRLITELQRQVSRVHVVVGYREELIINLCASQHREVVIVRNPDFRATNTVQSMALGARACNGKTLFMDGDLVIDPVSLADFIAKASHHETLVGITPSKSENPVNVRLSDGPECAKHPVVDSFTRDAGLPFEWANVVSCAPSILDDARGFVYEVLAKQTPVAAHEIDLREIDTVADLELARPFVQQVDKVLRRSDR